jgi:hypothetical protein
MNPAREVKTERFSRTEGKTPTFVELPNYQPTVRLTHSERPASPTFWKITALEAAQRIAGHADSRTTKLYEWRGAEGAPRRYGKKCRARHLERIRY